MISMPLGSRPAGGPSLISSTEFALKQCGVGLGALIAATEPAQFKGAMYRPPGQGCLLAGCLDPDAVSKPRQRRIRVVAQGGRFPKRRRIAVLTAVLVGLAPAVQATHGGERRHQPIWGAFHEGSKPPQDVRAATRDLAGQLKRTHPPIRLLIVHYHLEGTGVTSVIRQQVRTVCRLNIEHGLDITPLIAASFPKPQERDRATREINEVVRRTHAELGHTGDPTRVEIVDVPELEYRAQFDAWPWSGRHHGPKVSESEGDSGGTAGVGRHLAYGLIDRLSAGATQHATGVAFLHNTWLKTRTAGALAAALSERGVAVIEQQHDLPWERPYALKAMTQAVDGDATDPVNAVARFLLGDRMQVVLTPRDASLVTLGGYQGEHIGIAPNTVAPEFMSQPREDRDVVRRRVFEHLGLHPNRRLLLAPVKMRIRKNPNEWVALLRALNSMEDAYQLFVAVPGDRDSTEIRNLEELVRKHSLPVRIGFGNRPIPGLVPSRQQPLTIQDLMYAAHAVVNTPAKEPWGLTVFEAFLRGTPVVGREPPAVQGLLESDPFFYPALWMPLAKGAGEAIVARYMDAVDVLKREAAPFANAPILADRRQLESQIRAAKLDPSGRMADFVHVPFDRQLDFIESLHTTEGSGHSQALKGFMRANMQALTKLKDVVDRGQTDPDLVRLVDANAERARGTFCEEAFDHNFLAHITRVLSRRGKSWRDKLPAVESFFEVADAALAPSELHHGMLAERLGPQGQQENIWPQWLGEVKAQVDAVTGSTAWKEMLALLEQRDPSAARDLTLHLSMIGFRTRGFEAVYEQGRDLRSIHWLRYAHATVDFAQHFVTMMDGTNFWLDVDVSPEHRTAFANPHARLKGLELQNLLPLLRYLRRLDGITTMPALDEDLDAVVARTMADPCGRQCWENVGGLLEDPQLETAAWKVRELFSDAYWKSVIQTPIEKLYREENTPPPAAVCASAPLN